MKKELRSAYFAGLIDGEGHISMKSKGLGRSKAPTVEVKMTCCATINALANHFKVGNVRFVSRPKNRPHHKDQWKWYCTANAALYVLEEVIPFLITKKDEANKVYSMGLERRGG